MIPIQRIVYLTAKSYWTEKEQEEHAPDVPSQNVHSQF